MTALSFKFEVKNAVDGHSFVSIGPFDAYLPSLPPLDAVRMNALLDVTMRLHGSERAYALSWADELTGSQVNRVVLREEVPWPWPWSRRPLCLWAFDRGESREAVELIWRSPRIVVVDEWSCVSFSSLQPPTLHEVVRADTERLNAPPSGRFVLFGFHEHMWIDVHSGRFSAREFVERMGSERTAHSLSLEEVFNEM
ncbi:MAG: hypothetical protein HYV09_10795 [Deltaproteobacteria bacterium]|nr:hypothetical protein [Deltaproteobacteria bacterium]